MGKRESMLRNRKDDYTLIMIKTRGLAKSPDRRRFSYKDSKSKSELANMWRVVWSAKLTVGASSESIGILQQTLFYSYFYTYLAQF